MIELLMKMLLSFQQFEPKRLQSRNNRRFRGQRLFLIKCLKLRSKKK
jgi:hypothetical protein